MQSIPEWARPWVSQITVFLIDGGGGRLCFNGSFCLSPNESLEHRLLGYGGLPFWHAVVSTLYHIVVILWLRAVYLSAELYRFLLWGAHQLPVSSHRIFSLYLFDLFVAQPLSMLCLVLRLVFLLLHIAYNLGRVFVDSLPCNLPALCSSR